MRILVTGATDGIGRQTAIDLARLGAHVIVHGRSDERIRATQRMVARETGFEPEAVRADLSSLAEVRDLAGRVADGGPLDVIVQNAGIWSQDRRVTVDGFEATFAVNHLAPFLLTHLLLPSMPASGRIVHVSSGAHAQGRIAFDDPMMTGRYDAFAAYCQSKLANVLFSTELARRLPAGPTSNALHPGVVGTKLLREGFGFGGSETLEEGAATSVLLAMSPQVEGVTGGYFAASRASQAAPQARDVAAARRLYALSAEWVGIAGLPEPA